MNTDGLNETQTYRIVTKRVTMAYNVVINIHLQLVLKMFMGKIYRAVCNDVFSSLIPIVNAVSEA